MAWLHPENKNLDAFYDLINAMTSPEAGAYEIQSWEFEHVNKKAFDLVPEEVLADLVLSTPEALLNNGIYFAAVEPVLEEKYQAAVRRGKGWFLTQDRKIMFGHPGRFSLVRPSHVVLPVIPYRL